MKSTTLHELYNKIHEEGVHALKMYESATNDYYKKAWLAKVHATMDLLEKIETVQDCKYESKKTKFEKAVEIVVEELGQDLDYYRKDGWEIDNWSDLLDAMGNDSQMMKENVDYILKSYSNDNNVDFYLNDSYELVDEDGNIFSYRKLTNAVRKALF